MIIGIESLRPLEEIAARQVRIYSDACDVGVKCTDRLREQIRACCKDLAGVYKSWVRRSTSENSWGCFIPFEKDGAQYVGVRLTVTHLRTTRQGEWFLIDMYHTQQASDPFKEQVQG